MKTDIEKFVEKELAEIHQFVQKNRKDSNREFIRSRLFNTMKMCLESIKLDEDQCDEKINSFIKKIGNDQFSPFTFCKHDCMNAIKDAGFFSLIKNHQTIENFMKVYTKNNRKYCCASEHHRLNNHENYSETLSNMIDIFNKNIVNVWGKFLRLHGYKKDHFGMTPNFVYSNEENKFKFSPKVNAVMYVKFVTDEKTYNKCFVKIKTGDGELNDKTKDFIIKFREFIKKIDGLKNKELSDVGGDEIIFTFELDVPQSVSVGQQPTHSTQPIVATMTVDSLNEKLKTQLAEKKKSLMELQNQVNLMLVEIGELENDSNKLNELKSIMVKYGA